MADAKKSTDSELTEFRRALTDPKQTGKNPHFNSEYSTLHDVLTVVRAALDATGLDIVQTIDSPGQLSSEPGYVLRTVLSNGDATVATTVWPLELGGNPQKAGSLLTYARRYSLCVLCGIVGEEDDDGNAASVSAPPKAAHRSTRSATPARQALEGDDVIDAEYEVKE